MNSVADSQTNLDPERVRSVTENLSGLQGFSLRGLGNVVFGGLLATGQMANVYWKDSLWLGLGALPAIGLLAATLVYVPRYYRWRFGWVQPRPVPLPDWLSNISFKKFMILFGACSLLVFLLWVLGDLAGHALSVRINLMPLVTLLMLLCAALWLLRKMDRGTLRRRALHVIFLTSLLGIVVAFITFYPLWHSLDAGQLLLWKTLNAGSPGFFVIVLGLYDHIMLVRLVPKRVAEDDHE